MHLVSLASVLALASITSPASATWAPFKVVAASGQQFDQHATSDGSGGAIVVWIDTRNSSTDLYAQHVLSSDTVDPAWPVNGLPVGPLFDGEPAIASDGAGGAIIAWVETAAYGIYAAHVLSSGALDPSWPAGGVLVASGANHRIGISMVSDGSGGAILAWADDRNAATTDWDIFAQRVRSTGIVDTAWSSNGVAVCTAANRQDQPTAVSDGSGGIVIAWEDKRNGVDFDIYTQRITSTGTVAPGWTANGVALSATSGDQTGPLACTDAAGGAFVEWTDLRNGDEDVYAMRIRSTGSPPNGWHANGEVICTATGNQELSSLVADGSGNAVSAWADFRVGNGTSDVYAQKITGTSSKSWTANGAAVCTAANSQTEPSLAADGSGGVYVAWHDRRFEVTPTQAELFLHHVQSTGVMDPAWPASGGRVTFDGLGKVGQGHSPVMVPNAAGAATVLWDGSVDDVNALNLNATWTNLYPLVVSSTPSGAGTVTRNPDRLSYAANSVVTVTAVPNFGHVFIAWNGDASGSANPVSVTMSSAKNVSAIFDGYPINFTIVPSGTGTVSKSPNQSLFAPGTQVTLTAVPAGGYQFDHWGGDASGTTNPLTFTMGNGPVSDSASFVIAPPACGNWSYVTTAMAPSPRAGAPTVWDSSRHRVLLFGGYDGTNYLNDVWQFTVAGGWTRIIPAGTPPSPRDAAGLIYDPVRDRLLVIAGNNTVPPTDDWALSLSGTPTWTQLSTAGSAPPPLFGSSYVYDSVADRVLAFGGTSPSTNNTWALSLAGTPTWTLLSTSGAAPVQRYEHEAIFDPVRYRMIVHGGLAGATSVYANDTYALDLATLQWTPLSFNGPHIGYCPAIYDPVRDRMLMGAGYAPYSTGADSGKTWALSLGFPSDWVKVPTGGFPLDHRYFQGGVYEPDLDLYLLFNGLTFGYGIYINDTRRLDCAGGWWLQTGADAHGTVAVYPIPNKACWANGDHVTLQATGTSGWGFKDWLGDASGTNPLLDLTMDASKTVLAEFQSSPVAVEDEPLSFALQPIQPNPNHGPVRVTYELPREARVKLGVYDLAGRMVGRLVDGTQTAGQHTATWDTRLNGTPATTGIYFVRFETPAGTWTRRVALLR